MKLILSVSLVALFAATSLTASGQSSQLDILALDPAGAAIQFAEIVVRDNAGYQIASGSTNGSGGFDLKNVGPGVYEVVARALGFEAHTETVVIPESTITKLVVKLAASPDAVKSGLDVLLLDPSGAVISNVQILVENQERMKVVNGTTNMAGRIRLAGLTPGTYVLSSRPPGFADLKDTVTVQPGQMVEVRLTLQIGRVVGTGVPYSDPQVATATSSLYALVPEVALPDLPLPQVQTQEADSAMLLFVFDASSAAVPKAQVAVVNHAGKHVAEGTTNRSGRLRLSKLAPGTYDVLVQARGFSMSRREGVVVPPHKTVDVEVKLMTGISGMMDEIVSIAGAQTQSSPKHLGNSQRNSYCDAGLTRSSGDLARK